MLPLGSPDRIHVAFDDHRLVTNAGLLLPVTLAQHLGLRELVDNNVDRGETPGRANPGDKLLTLVASALAGGDCIDDADVLRAGRTARVLGCVVKAPSTLGTFLRSFRWGHVRQLDRVSRELLARAWAAGSGPGDAPLTIDLDSTTCETYGLAKEGARRHGYTGQRGYHPLLAVAAGTGDVLMARLRRAAPTPLAAPLTSCGRRWGGYATLVPGDNSRCGPTAASTPTPWSSTCRRDECPLLHHHPPTPEPAQSHRGHTREGLDAHPLLDGRRRRCGRDHVCPLPRCARRRAGAAHRPAGQAHALLPVGPLGRLQLPRLHHRP